MKTHNIDFLPNQHNQDRKKNLLGVIEKNTIATCSKDLIDKKLHKANEAELNFTNSVLETKLQCTRVNKHDYF